MTKFSYFTLFLSFTVTVVVAEMLVNDYVSVDLQANLLNNQVHFQQSDSFDLATNAEQTKVKRRPLENEKTKVPQPNVANKKPQNEVQLPLPKSLSFQKSDLREIGLFDPIINIMPLDPKIFGIFAMPTDAAGNFKQAQIMEENTIIGMIQEYKFKDPAQAEQQYNQLKAAALELNYFTVNEVLNYGDKSFYLNHGQRKDQVFIVMKKNNQLWAITYVRRLHPKFKELLISLGNGK